MSYTALIKLGRLVTVDVLRNVDALPPEGLFFQRGALQLHGEVLVCVDHDEGRRIGIVRELAAIPDTDGEWVAALATIANAPAWLRAGSGASLSYINLHTSTLGKATRVMRGLVTEVSVLTPSRRPAEPGARVATFHRDDQRSSPVARPSDRAAPGVFYGDGQMIVRPGIGQVLRVR